MSRRAMIYAAAASGLEGFADSALKMMQFKDAAQQRDILLRRDEEERAERKQNMALAQQRQAAEDEERAVRAGRADQEWAWKLDAKNQEQMTAQQTAEAEAAKKQLEAQEKEQAKNVVMIRETQDMPLGGRAPSSVVALYKRALGLPIGSIEKDDSGVILTADENQTFDTPNGKVEKLVVTNDQLTKMLDDAIFGNEETGTVPLSPAAFKFTAEIRNALGLEKDPMTGAYLQTIISVIGDQIKNTDEGKENAKYLDLIGQRDAFLEAMKGYTASLSPDVRNVTEQRSALRLAAARNYEELAAKYVGTKWEKIPPEVTLQLNGFWAAAGREKSDSPHGTKENWKAYVSQAVKTDDAAESAQPAAPKHSPGRAQAAAVSAGSSAVAGENRQAAAPVVQEPKPVVPAGMVKVEIPGAGIKLVPRENVTALMVRIPGTRVVGD